jgi:cytochrome c oxidase cbb3-type subunit 1
MDRIVVWYLRMSVIYFVFGALVGLVMTLWPDESGYYTSSHVHLNLLGFMSMMIYGVGYHILPKFSGRHIYSPSLMKIQFWFANAGLIGMAISWSFIMRDSLFFFFDPFFTISALCSVVAVCMFAINILKTIKAA